MRKYSQLINNKIIKLITFNRNNKVIVNEKCDFRFSFIFKY